MGAITEGGIALGKGIRERRERKEKKTRLADIVNSLQGLEDATAVGNLGNASSKLEDVIGSVEDIDELSDVLSVFKSVKSLSQPAGTPKERAIGALGQGATLPGLSLDETKKLAGVVGNKFTPQDLKAAIEGVTATTPFEFADILPAKESTRERLVKQLRSKQLEQFLTTDVVTPKVDTSTGRIRVKGPDGKIGTIPESQLKEALAGGFERL